ncbi:MAG: urease accessory protein UreD [Neomegalonema sp.]|nr:urease accessory protein UreD [Neomegalonema sp.]
MRGKAEIGVKAGGVGDGEGDASPSLSPSLPPSPSRLAHLYQSGSAKCILPRTHDGICEAVLINTAGGITDGDHLLYEASAAAGARLTLTTQAAERIYKAQGRAPGRLEVSLSLGAGARLDWVPQETILFEGGRLARSLTVQMAADARLLVSEMVVLGRSAMGERVCEGFFGDQWRIHRGGALVYAEAQRLSAPVDLAMVGPGCGQGARAFATLLLIAPDAEDLLDEARAALTRHDGVIGGASAWNGMLALRLLGAQGNRDASALRRAVIDLTTTLRGCPPPRVWNL